MIRLRDVYQVRPVRPEVIQFLYRLLEQRMTEPETNISATMPTMLVNDPSVIIFAIKFLSVF